jgi:hypothetical protein
MNKPTGLILLDICHFRDEWMLVVGARPISNVGEVVPMGPMKVTTFPLRLLRFKDRIENAQIEASLKSLLVSKDFPVCIFASTASVLLD